MKNRLKVYRAMRDLTQEDLAKILEVSRGTINSIEKDRYDPSIRLAFRIARFFEVRVEDVFDDEAAGHEFAPHGRSEG